MAKDAVSKAKPAPKHVKKCAKKMAAPKVNAAKHVKKPAKRRVIRIAKRELAAIALKKVHKHTPN
jgi:hypothetical protein